ncbi:MAG: response regulator [Deltaproteobacteria bacterium]|nr:response regulator [Deltaproteobacteria bacterium]MBW2017285.1 response regulator [Deltaproteobacteria bacterium]MBW2129733.1 response regulator [Deltaproteobacteria bacterium]MBW2304336.1 response regulator [Deltaproteobacteria bacterium]
MSTLTIFSGTFCGGESVVKEVLARLNCRLVRDEDIVAVASKASGIPEAKMMKAFSSKTSVFNRFTHEKERSIAYLRLAVAEGLADDNLLITGFTSHLIPREVSHVLRVCLIADMKSRISTAVKEHRMTEKEAMKLIRKQDEDRAVWVHALLNKNDPWDSSLYDIVIPTDKTGPDDAAALIEQNAAAEAVRPTTSSRRAAEDFLLAARVDVALANEGHNVPVEAREGSVTLTINKHVLMLSRVKEELREIATKVPGVKSVETKVGKDFYQADVYRKFNFELPSKVLLVDDEREFVQTLSERLIMRDMGSAVAYDGESALNMVNEDEPDVMILDLKMPGIDGIEVLRQVKESHPEIEVIILTGHGSEADRDVCMKLGAFAYLQKPVDIDVLSETLKKAYERIRLQRETRRQGA